jgi:AP-2 complex subunit alpha
MHQVFISDIRACQNKEQESRRVDKELAKIRGKFGDEKKSLSGGSNQHMTAGSASYSVSLHTLFAHLACAVVVHNAAYDRKKYVWKLLYIYMLGYDVEFGHKQACDLIPAQK